MKTPAAFGAWLPVARRDAPFSIAALIGLALALLPGARQSPLLVAYAAVVTLLIGVSTIAVRWERYPVWFRGLPALLYFGVIELLQSSTGDAVTGFGPLTVLPIVWLALYGTRMQLLMATVATTIIFGLPILHNGGPAPARNAALRLFLLWSIVAPIVGFTLRALIVRSRIEYSRAEAILRAATEHSVIGTDARGIITVFNAGAHVMLGYRADEVVGKATPLLVHDPGEIAARAAALGIAPGFDVLTGPCANGESETREWAYVRKDGSRLRVMLTMAPLGGDDGKVTGYVGIAVDVSQLRQIEASLTRSEQRYRALADTIPQKIWVIDDAGRIGYANTAWKTYTGVREPDTAAALDDPVHHEDRALLRGRFTASPGVNLDAFELRLRRADGAYRWHLVRMVPLPDDDHAAGKWIVSATDIEERKAAEAELAAAHLLALEASAAKTRFLATMSHELRTPMNGIIGMCELLLHTPLGGEEREIAGVVYDSAKSLLRTLNDVLDFSKMETGGVQLRAIPFNIADEVRAVIDLQRPQANHKQIVLRRIDDERIANEVIGDAGRLRQILLNVVSNAIKFTPAGGAVSLAIRTRERTAERIVVEFRITDCGPGIPPAIRDAIFEPFVQADGTITRRHGGTGLGLTICRQLVELMGGTIAVDATATTGTSIVFAVPFALAGDVPERSAPAADRQHRALPDFRPERILLAEDNPINALLAVKQLRRLGFDTVVAVDGAVAVARWQERVYDLVLMDCHMPEMDGFTATRAIRAFDRAHPERPPAIIVAMTADARAQDREACAAAGMNDYIAKPAEIADLDRVLERWLGPAVVIRPALAPLRHT